MESTLCHRYGRPQSLSLPTRAPSAINGRPAANLQFSSRPSSISLVCAAKSHPFRQVLSPVTSVAAIDKSSMLSMNIGMGGYRFMRKINNAGAFPKVFCQSTPNSITPSEKDSITPSEKDSILYKSLFHFWLEAEHAAQRSPNGDKPNDKPTDIASCLGEVVDIPIIEVKEIQHYDEAGIAYLKMNILKRISYGDKDAWKPLLQGYNARIQENIKDGKLPDEIEINLGMALVEVLICQGKFRKARKEISKLDAKVADKEKSGTEKSGLEIKHQKQINLYKAVIHAALHMKEDAIKYLNAYVENVKQEETGFNLMKLPDGPPSTSTVALSSLVLAMVFNILEEEEARNYWVRYSKSIFK